MRYEINLRVRLKIPDVTAITARQTLQRRLGYAEVLLALQREDDWRLTVEVPDEAAAQALGVELAEGTNLFVNPNKHTYICRVSRGHSGPEKEDSLPLSLAKAESPVSPPGGEGAIFKVAVLTGFYEDASASLTLEALRNRLGYGDPVVEVERGTRWTFTLRADTPEEARRLVEEMVVTRGAHRGLLINPHSQWWRWVD
ncbi:MAG TPA: hypothetical protein EYP85_02550 [Armatimonadetes bacterium]|nr:hypothetical protein [Armatimonadota bacterium]